jgi:hypothetical protein
MPTSASPQSHSWFARVQRWLGLDDDDAASECPCAVAARIERAAAQARAERAAEKEAAKLMKAMRKQTSIAFGEQRSGSGFSQGTDASTEENPPVVCEMRSASRSKLASEASKSERTDEARYERAATYAMGGLFHSGFLADTFVYLPEVWVGADGEH